MSLGVFLSSGALAVPTADEIQANDRAMAATIIEAGSFLRAGGVLSWRDWREMTLLALVGVAAPFFLFSQASVWLPAGYVALVNSTGDFTEQHLVTNGASDLIGQVFGDKGAHARSAFGVARSRWVPASKSR